MSSAEKTEKPTPQRLRKEGRKGKSFNSRDLLAAGVLWIGVAMMATVTTLAPVSELYRHLVLAGGRMPPAKAAAAALAAFARGAAPLLLATILVIALISFAMSRGRIASEALKIDFSRLNPVNGAKNLFTMKVVKDLVRSLLYLLLAAVFCRVAWHLWGPDLFSLVHAEAPAAAWRRMATVVAIGLLVAIAPVCLLSGWLDHMLFIREMKMEKHEVRREHKENEMRPELKQRRSEIAEELSAQTQADTLGSNVILANPTHIAIGIFVPDEDSPYPFVSVREKGRRARKVIALAERNGIPVVRDVRLARAVYRRSRRYRFVADEDIDSVMHVIRWLHDVARAADTVPAAEDVSSVAPTDSNPDRPGGMYD